MLVADTMGSLTVRVVMVMLLAMVWMVTGVLELRQWHSKSLVRLPSIHHGMLRLVPLRIHAMRIMTR